MQIKLRFDETSYENPQVTELQPGRFRLEDTPFLPIDPLYPGDIIEAQQLTDGSYRYVGVVERAPMKHHSWLLPRSFVQSSACQDFAGEIERAGGRWETIAGGTLRAHLPQDSTLDVEATLQRYLNSGWGEA